MRLKRGLGIGDHGRNEKSGWAEESSEGRRPRRPNTQEGPENGSCPAAVFEVTSSIRNGTPGEDGKVLPFAGITRGRFNGSHAKPHDSQPHHSGSPNTTQNAARAGRVKAGGEEMQGLVEPTLRPENGLAWLQSRFEVGIVGVAPVRNR